MSELSFQERAERVLSDTFGGLHNVPGKVKPCGNGLEVSVFGSLSSYDFNQLTRLVLSAHKHCVRVDIGPAMRKIQIMLHPRQREGRMCERHPTIEQAIAQFDKDSERQG